LFRAYFTRRFICVSSSAFCATARHGLGAAAVAGRIKPLCKRFDDLCAQDYPIGCIGYSYCLERIAALKDKTDIEKVRTLCPDGVDATRFLRSHSSLGSEASHVEETIAFVASLPANDRISVVQETYESALIMAEGYHHELLKSEAEMLEEIRQAIGEAFPYSRGSVSLDTQERGTRPVA